MSKNGELATEVAKNYNRAKSYGLQEVWSQTYFGMKAIKLRRSSNVAKATIKAVIYASETCINILRAEATQVE
jgi:hypothetical protein|tara:strand:+ start:335 stop:553 length:219 start_codon:yes stop_codon:yes gene_type:complete